MRRFLPFCPNPVLLLLFVAALGAFFDAALPFAPWTAAAAGPAAPVREKDEEVLFSARREFRGAVRRDMAERVAGAAAELAAYDRAARLLAREPDVHFAAGVENGDALSLDGLARLVFTTRTRAVGAEGFPPFLASVVRVALVRPEEYRERLVEALASEDALEIHGQALARERELVARYDALAPYLLSLPGLDEGGREQMHALQAMVNELVGLADFLALIDGRESPEGEPRAVKERLERIERLAPDNPLVLNALAEVWLRLDRPLTALDYAARATDGAPGFARAHDTQGAVLLRQRLPLMAARSFGKAIELAPRNASYYMNRASAYLVLEETEAMCADFQRACALGDCDGLIWASEERRCNKDAP